MYSPQQGAQQFWRVSSPTRQHVLYFRRQLRASVQIQYDKEIVQKYKIMNGSNSGGVNVTVLAQ